MEFDSTFSLHHEVHQSETDFLWEGINEYNKSSGPMLKYPPYEPYRIVIKDQDNQIIAGILTYIYLKCMAVELLWVSQSMRDQGIGSELLRRVESHAKDKGCVFIHLDTFNFQAIDFYIRHGYSEFGRISDYPGEVERYYLKKEL
jgi:GNAT superfamily N-acetyltransferase